MSAASSARRLVAIVASVSATAVAAAEVPSVLARVGAPTAGSGGLSIATINDPYVDGLGRPGFTGQLAGAQGNIGFVWVQTGIAWLNTDAAPILLTGTEGTCGISDDGGWTYSPTEDGEDAVWSNGARIVREGDAAPSLKGQFITFASRPQMNADGTPTWISGLTDTEGGATQGRVLYAGTTPLIRTGDVFGALVVDSVGVGFAYDFSSDGGHWIVRARSGPSPFTFFMVLDGVNVLQTGQPAAGIAGNWQNFDDCGVNGAGDWVVSGDTDAAAASDGFLAYNGTAIAREGDLVAGLVLNANPRSCSIADNGRIGAIWNTDQGEALFLFTQDAAGGFGADVLLKVGDLVDSDGDGIVDAAVTDFNASTTVAPGLRLPDRCRVYVNVDITIPGAPSVEAIVSVPLPELGLAGDLDGDGDVDAADLAILLGAWGSGGASDLNCDGTTDAADLAILLGGWTG